MVSAPIIEDVPLQFVASWMILGAGILYFLLYLPYTILINYDTQTRTWQKIVAVKNLTNETEA